jgi:hypothetical protein
VTEPQPEDWRKAMAKEFENPEEEKVEDEIADDKTPEEREERVADRLASKSGKRVQEYDKEHNVFSK